MRNAAVPGSSIWPRIARRSMTVPRTGECRRNVDEPGPFEFALCRRRRPSRAAPRPRPGRRRVRPPLRLRLPAPRAAARCVRPPGRASASGRSRRASRARLGREVLRASPADVGRLQLQQRLALAHGVAEPGEQSHHPRATGTPTSAYARSSTASSPSSVTCSSPRRDSTLAVVIRRSRSIPSSMRTSLASPCCLWRRWRRRRRLRRRRRRFGRPPAGGEHHGSKQREHSRHCHAGVVSSQFIAAPPRSRRCRRAPMRPPAERTDTGRGSRAARAESGARLAGRSGPTSKLRVVRASFSSSPGSASASSTRTAATRRSWVGKSGLAARCGRGPARRRARLADGAPRAVPTASSSCPFENTGSVNVTPPRTIWSPLFALVANAERRSSGLRQRLGRWPRRLGVADGRFERTQLGTLVDRARQRGGVGWLGQAPSCPARRSGLATRARRRSAPSAAACSASGRVALGPRPRQRRAREVDVEDGDVAGAVTSIGRVDRRRVARSRPWREPDPLGSHTPPDRTSARRPGAPRASSPRRSPSP